VSRPVLSGNQQGFALPTAIVALVLVAIMVVGGFSSVSQEYRIGVGSQLSSEAFYAAEEAITRVLADWNPAVVGVLPLFEPLTLNGAVDGSEWEVDIRRVSDRSYFLDSRATVVERGILAGATRRIGAMVKVRTAELAPPAALTTRGNVSVRGTAEVHGGNVNPITWGGVCTAPDPSSDAPGVMTDATGNVTLGGSAEITGNPASVQNPNITAGTFQTFGDLSWAELIELADKRYPGGTFNGTGPVLDALGQCNRAAASNWGDPINPGGACGNYFPIIHITGTALIQSGAVGQGILLVDGDLELRGNFIWHGVVIVQGTLGTQGSGNRIMGGVWAGNADLDNQALVGGSVVQYSTCAAERAILNNTSLSRARLLPQRGWVDLSSAGETG
jgi:type II secretory pathway pseudopilin PulG